MRYRSNAFRTIWENKTSRKMRILYWTETRLKKVSVSGEKSEPNNKVKDEKEIVIHIIDILPSCLNKKKAKQQHRNMGIFKPLIS